MNSILVPTDFSACARHAEKVAVALARRFGARLHLVHQVENLSGSSEAEVEKEWEQASKNTRLLLQNTAAQYPDLDIELSIVRGKLVEAIVEYVEEKGIDFLVMGSHGRSGKNEFFVGSNTQKVVRLVHQPVLVVKQELGKVHFEKVIFASNFNESVQEPFLRFKEFIKHFIPEIHLLAIQTSSFFEPPYIVTRAAMEEFKGYCTPFKCETHIFQDFSVDQGIRSFAKEIGAELIAISNHERHPMKRMLVGSNIEALINHAEIPVLSIDFPKGGNSKQKGGRSRNRSGESS